MVWVRNTQTGAYALGEDSSPPMRSTLTGAYALGEDSGPPMRSTGVGVYVLATNPDFAPAATGDGDSIRVGSVIPSSITVSSIQLGS